jgi:hypothetical protein
VRKGLVLRDATAFNIQFPAGRPLLIDTLSFGLLTEGEPWLAYRQFCQHFLAPLALMAYTDPSLGQLSRVFIDGIPLEVAARLLPKPTLFRPGLLMHLHLHARSIAHGLTGPSGATDRMSLQKRMGRTALLGLIDSLESTVQGLACRRRASIWSDYYADTNYSAAAQQHKEQVVASMIETAAGRAPLSMIWDLGANTGLYSRAAAAGEALVVAFDMDHGAVDRHYNDCVRRGETKVLPLVQDFLNPSGGIGWMNHERRSLVERGPADLVLALALVHHLAIAGNVPFDEIARFLHAIGRKAIVEFVPKTDSQVLRMLAARADVFSDFHQDAFEERFGQVFRILDRKPVRESCRTLYLMEAR